MIALGAGLVARGHKVRVETWERWRPQVHGQGMGFVPAPEYPVFATAYQAAEPYKAAADAAQVTRQAISDWRPDACVCDILTLAASFAAELESVPWSTLVPHVLPLTQPGLPPYPLGGRPARTPVGRSVWRAAGRLAHGALELGRRQNNEARAALGLPPLPYHQTGLSRTLTLVATLPQLEYPRRWPEWTRLVGPLLWEPPGAPEIKPSAKRPVVLVAPSTAQDREGHLLRCALAGLAREEVDVIAVGDPALVPAETLPANAKLVSWLSYARTMPHCDVVVTHAGHGTLARALVSGCPVVACPAGGDMAENAARAEWAGLGVRVPSRLLGPRTLRVAVRRVLADQAMRRRCASVAAWAGTHDAAGAAARELEELLRRSG